VADRVAKQRKDPWAGYAKAKQSLSRAAIKQLAALK
jgi:23S rRNA U2552 (ribose-2'-O)-methylase RlmE/FtsJ